MYQIYLERGRTIRKAILKMNEELKYQTIKLLADKHLTIVSSHIIGKTANLIGS